MAETQTIKAIRTQAGDLKIDYAALEHKPTPKKFSDSVVDGDFADAKSFKDKINRLCNSVSVGNKRNIGARNYPKVRI